MILLAAVSADWYEDMASDCQDANKRERKKRARARREGGRAERDDVQTQKDHLNAHYSRGLHLQTKERAGGRAGGRASESTHHGGGLVVAQVDLHLATLVGVGHVHRLDHEGLPGREKLPCVPMKIVITSAAPAPPSFLCLSVCLSLSLSHSPIEVVTTWAAL